MNTINYTLSKVFPIVKRVLKDMKWTRDCDLDLMHEVYKELGIEFYDNWGHVLECIKAKQLPAFETIRRARQKIQEKHENLRGEKWAKRHRIAENVKTELREL